VASAPGDPTPATTRGGVGTAGAETGAASSGAGAGSPTTTP
jgi:hypothetical protein